MRGIRADGATANTAGNQANLTNQEQWMGLCELAYNEHDQEKLGALFEGILRLLEAQQVDLLYWLPRGVGRRVFFQTGALVWHEMREHSQR
jgi:hypothetical protein